MTSKVYVALRVRATPERAFAAFVEEIGAWWRPSELFQTTPRPGRLSFEPGESRRVSFTLSSRDLSLIDEAGKRVFSPGRYRLFIGGSQPDERSGDLIGEDPLSLDIELVGAPSVMQY